MSLQKRLVMYLLIAAPVAWLMALVFSVHQTKNEVNELFDAQMIHLARQVQTNIFQLEGGNTPASNNKTNLFLEYTTSDTDLNDIGIAAWDQAGKHVLVDAGSVIIPYISDASGFVNMDLGNESWRIYYLQEPGAALVIAAGQKLYERDELVWNLVGGQILPWLIVLPVLIGAMSIAIRVTLAPIIKLTRNINQRQAGDLEALKLESQPLELKPLIHAMNQLFDRVDSLLQRERRFTADAAHELRTPLAVIRTQWSNLQRAQNSSQELHCQKQLENGFERMERLVTQMLEISKLDAAETLPNVQPIDWHVLIGQTVSDVLPLSDTRNMTISCQWPDGDLPPFPVVGNSILMGILLRNILDNALRYGSSASAVEVKFSECSLTVTNQVSDLAGSFIERWGDRFYRPAGSEQSGSGLGASIVQRIAALHKLHAQVFAPDTQHISVRLKRA